ncbi:MAG: hypothetical protein D8M57_10465 [Candidatus Scalindua sp. AMX11]|nr:MAG: hypothetical protein DWQ00_01600 [Candidatus Scalindua sp.]TDE65012.1 MAG: hypothetical protein D8M57_10465 [Candidatus Scalindua sp. AMX11]
MFAFFVTGRLSWSIIKEIFTFGFVMASFGEKLMKKAYCLFWLVLAVISFPFISQASQVDFSWSVPEKITYKMDSGEEKEYIIWFYSIRNTTDKEILVPVETFLTTDTQKNYTDIFIEEVVSTVTEGENKYMTAHEMKGEFGPGVTKNGVALFEDIDPYALEINIFVTGLSHFFFWRWRMVDYSYKITYKKSGTKWFLVEHGFSKDSSHRNSSDWTNQLEK